MQLDLTSQQFPEAYLYDCVFNAHLSWPVVKQLFSNNRRIFNAPQMEKYSKHLEAIVAERTQDLLQEKQKTDRLLYSKL